jgi:PAS domain S-box-containing protein
LFQASPTAIFTLDLQEKVTLWNPTAVHTFGWHKAEILGRSLPFIPEDKRNEYLALREGVFRGQTFTDIELHFKKKDGSPIDISCSMTPLRDASGNIVGVMSTNVDITARIGGDEFAIIAAEITELNPDAFSKRLQQNIDEYNARGSRPYKLAMSWGTAIYDPAFPASLDELMSAADKFMYQRKGKNKHTIQNLRPVSL